MAKEKRITAFKIVKFVVGFNWYAMLVLFVFMSVLLVAILFGVEPSNLHTHSPIVVTYVQEDLHQDYPDSKRPVVTEIKGMATVLEKSHDIPYLKMRVVAMYLMLLLYIFGSYQLRQVIKIIGFGEPFAPEIPGRIQKIAYIVMAWGPLFGATLYFQGWISLYLIREKLPGVKIEPDLHLEFVFLGLILLIIAQVMKKAVEMYREQNLTV